MNMTNMQLITKLFSNPSQVVTIIYFPSGLQLKKYNSR